MLSLAEVSSREECVERVREQCSRLDAIDPACTRWLLAGGARVEAWREPRWPTRDQLDAIVGPRCASIMSFDHHALLASKAAFAAAGIADDAPDPDGGVIVRDPRTREPTGLLLESAAWLVRRATPEPAGDELLAVVRASLADLASHAFVEVHDLLAPATLGPALATLHDRGELALRVGLFAPLEEIESQHAMAHAGGGGWARRDAVALVGGKVFVDGTLNSRTAWMLAPFRNPLAGHPCGTPLMSVEQISGAIRRCGALGLGLAAHAIGDGAVRAVLDAAERVGRPSGNATPTLRIEHAELIDALDVPRFAQLGVVASVQPCHLLYDIEVLERELPDRLDRVLPLRDLVASGLVPGQTLLFGSDTPIVRPHPQDSINAAVHRRRITGSPGGPETHPPIGPDQSIGERDAWAAFGG